MAVALRVNVCAKGARNLKRTETWSEQDPYLRIWCSQNKADKQVSKVHDDGGANALWNFVTIYDINDPEKEFLFLEVMNKNRLFSDNNIGRARVSVGSLCKGDDVGNEDQWVRVFTDSGESSGEVNLTVSWKPVPTAIPVSVAPVSVETRETRAESSSTPGDLTMFNYASPKHVEVPEAARKSEKPAPEADYASGTNMLAQMAAATSRTATVTPPTGATSFENPIKQRESVVVATSAPGSIAAQVVRDESPVPTPVVSAPVASAPVASTPVVSAPVESAPVASAPVASAPVTSAPVASAPVVSAPVASAPVVSAPAPSVPGGFSAGPVAYSNAPVASAPVVSAPAPSVPGGFSAGPVAYSNAPVASAPPAVPAAYATAPSVPQAPVAHQAHILQQTSNNYYTPQQPVQKQAYYQQPVAAPIQQAYYQQQTAAPVQQAYYQQPVAAPVQQAYYQQPVAAPTQQQAYGGGAAALYMKAHAPAPVAVASAPAALPPGWTEKTDPSSGRVYYSNSISKTTTWTRPV